MSKVPAVYHQLSASGDFRLTKEKLLPEVFRGVDSNKLPGHAILEGLTH